MRGMRVTKRPFREDGVIGQKPSQGEEIIDMEDQLTFEEVVKAKEDIITKVVL